MLNFDPDLSRTGYRRKRGFVREHLFFIIAALFVVAFVVFAGVAAYNAQQDCVAMGGVYEDDGECEVDREDVEELD